MQFLEHVAFETIRLGCNTGEITAEILEREIYSITRGLLIAS